MMAKLPPAYCVRVVKPGTTETFIVYGLRSGRRELALRQRLNPGCTVVLTKIATA